MQVYVQLSKPWDVFGACFYTLRALILCTNALSCELAHQGLDFQVLLVLLASSLSEAPARIFLLLFSYL